MPWYAVAPRCATPPTLTWAGVVLGEMQGCAEAIGLDARQVIPLLGGYVFLRFFSPAIVAPEVHGVLPTAPSLEARRSLVLISKVNSG